MFCNPR